MAKKKKDKIETKILSEEEIAELCSSNEYLDDIPLEVISKNIYVEKRGNEFLIKNKSEIKKTCEEDGLSIAG